MATTEAQPAGASASGDPSWQSSLQQLLRELPGLVSDRVELMSLELQLAGRVLAQMVMLVMTAAILGVTAWLALWGGVLFGLIDAGLHWAAASCSSVLPRWRERGPWRRASFQCVAGARTQCIDTAAS